MTSDNYEITFENGVLTVAAKQLAKPEAVAKSYTYNGTEQSFELTGFDASTMTISGDKQTDANETGYTVAVTLKDADNFAWSTADSCTFTWVIAKAPVDVPTINSKVFTGENLKAEVPASVLYTVTENAGGVAAGNYDVVLTLTDSANYKWTDSDAASRTLIFTITKEANSWTTEPAISDVTYGTAISPVYGAKFGNSNVVINYAGTGSTDYTGGTTAPTQAGTYKATFTVAATSDYGSLSKDVEFSIKKAASTVTTAPAANTLTYNGTAQALVTAGEANGGTMQYKLGTDGTYSDTVPTATDAGTYTVYYKVAGDSNHNDSTEDSVVLTISPLNITGAAVGAFAAMTYTGSVQMPVAAVTLENFNITGSWSSVTKVADTTTFTATGNFTGTITGVATGMAKATVTAPSIDSKVYTGEKQTAEVPVSALYTVTANNGGTEAGSYDVVLTLTDPADYRWTGSEEAALTLKFEITERPKYAVHGYSDAFGNAVTADYQNAEKDTRIALTIISAEEYSLQELTVKNTSGASITLTPDNTFLMPESDVTVNAGFTKNTYGITDYGDAFGNAVTADLRNAEKGAKVRLTVSSAADYIFKSLSVTDAAGNTIDVTADNTFEMPGTSVTVNAIFEKYEMPVGVIIQKNVDDEEDAGNGSTSGKETDTDSIAGKEDALVFEGIDSVQEDAEAVAKAIGTAAAEGNTRDFIFRADENTVTEQGIENKAYADAAAGEVTEVTKPSETRSVTLDSTVMEALSDAEAKSLTVMTSVADVEFDAKTIEAINEQSEGDVRLVVTLVKEEIAKNETGENKAYYEVSLIREDGTEITNLNGGSISVTLPIPKACQNEPVVVVYSDGKGHYSPVDGHVNADGTYTFVTKHLSEYILMTRSEAEEKYNRIFDFGTLRPHAAERTEDSVTIEWDSYEDADGYIIYGSYCNHDGKTYRVKKLTTIKDASVTAYTAENLESGTFYKFRVKAYKLVNGEKYVTVKSKYIHTATLGGKRRVTSGIELDRTGMKKNNTLSLKAGKNYTISAKHLTVDGKEVKHVKLRFESTDKAVAVVTKKGTITAAGKGTCTVMVIAENGIYEEITVTVK